MGELVPLVVPQALGVGLSPVPILSVLLVLNTSRADRNGPAFAAGWIAGHAVVAGAVLVIATRSAARSADPSGAEPGRVLTGALGVLLLLLACWQWRVWARRNGPPAPPRWMTALDRFTPGRSAGLALLLVGLNPKNVGLTVAAALTLAGTGASAGRQAAALAVYVLIGSAGILLPLGLHRMATEQAARALDRWRTWMMTRGEPATVVVLLVLSAVLLAQAVGGPA